MFVLDNILLLWDDDGNDDHDDGNEDTEKYWVN